MKYEANEAVYICSHIFEDTRPILFVSKEDGDWQFLCGDTHPGETPHVVCLGHILDRDTTLNELLDLPDNWEAERELIGGAWQRRICASEE